jgi:hypothetical protein
MLQMEWLNASNGSTMDPNASEMDSYAPNGRMDATMDSTMDEHQSSPPE